MTDDGEGAEFNNAAICKKIIETYRLTEIAKSRSIRMAVAKKDRFQMTKNYYHDGWNEENARL
jgi:hypothetical protein